MLKRAMVFSAKGRVVGRSYTVAERCGVVAAEMNSPGAGPAPQVQQMVAAAKINFWHHARRKTHGQGKHAHRKLSRAASLWVDIRSRTADPVLTA